MSQDLLSIRHLPTAICIIRSRSKSGCSCRRSRARSARLMKLAARGSRCENQSTSSDGGEFAAAGDFCAAKPKVTLTFDLFCPIISDHLPVYQETAFTNADQTELMCPARVRSKAGAQSCREFGRIYTWRDFTKQQQLAALEVFRMNRFVT